MSIEWIEGVDDGGPWSAAKPRLLRLWRRTPAWVQGRNQWLLLPKFLVGSAVVLDDAERVLLFRHTYRNVYSRRAYPRGWLKAGEAPATLLNARSSRNQATGSERCRYSIGGDKALRRLDLIFLCDLVGDAFRPSAEVSDAGFFTAHEIDGRVEPFHVQVAAYAAKVMRGWWWANRRLRPLCPHVKWVQ